MPISSRLASARLKGTTVNLTVVAVYAPTLDAAEGAKDSFYADIQDAVDRVPAGDMLFVTGDWNARPGPVDMATRHILCKFAVGTRCANCDCRIGNPSLLIYISRNYIIDVSPK